MRRRRIAGTALELTEVCFGGAVIGNLYRATTTETAVAAVDAAWDAGVRYFDTAPHYGLGLSEQRLGLALAGRPRREFTVSSKVGRLLVRNEHPGGRDTQGFDVPDDLRRQWDWSREGVRRSVEETLRRTGLDRLDVVYVHDPDAHWRQAADEAMPELARMRDEGLVGAIGAGMNQSAMLTRFLRETAADLVMLAGRYTLLEQDALDDVLPAARESGKSVVAAGVFNSGLLARNRPSAELTYNYATAPPELVARARTIAEVCERHGTSLPAAAIVFPLAHPAVVSVALGMGTPEQVTRNTALYRQGVPDSLWAELRERGLLRADAPVPAAAPADAVSAGRLGGGRPAV
ncbi:aldo/keto reductase [Streptomyces sp. NPDC092296]|uniref:aldo/keto reductase n=1 Tax=Streptomyces sp. NPDC092296 TaxID=3366012 RepID=UPI00382B0CBF